MEASRRLRKSVLNSYGEIDLNSYKIESKNGTRINKKILDYKQNESISFKTKFLIKSFVSTIILFTVIICKIFFYETLITNENYSNIVNHYNSDFTKLIVLEKIEDFLNKNINVIENIVPNSIIEFIKNKYNLEYKNKIVKFSLINIFEYNYLAQTLEPSYSFVDVKEKIEKQVGKNTISVEDENIVEKNSSLSIGVGEPVISVNSKVNDIRNEVELIRSKDMQLVIPTYGTITSRYGVREIIFEGTDPFHYGVDIANSIGTEIVSVSDGIVLKTVLNNKYLGNYIEIKSDEVVFRYGHLEKILVAEGDVVTANELIALMGSTGMSTGSHLHFEIEINDVKVNPEDIMEFKW